jgi:uncharacterized protein (TIGR00730 family)
VNPLEQDRSRSSVGHAAPYRARMIADVAMFIRISFQFWRGFHFLRNTRRAITVFGSARTPDQHPYCELARAVARAIGEQGIAIVTGGGGAVMQAANRGAFEAGAPSIGINITIEREQKANPYLTRSLVCRYFFVRKVLLCRYSEAFVILPGGFGTLDEFFEIITLIQTGKMRQRPVVLIGSGFWDGLLDWCRQTLIPQGMITEAEFARIHVADTADEALARLGIQGPSSKATSTATITR